MNFFPTSRKTCSLSWIMHLCVIKRRRILTCSSTYWCIVSIAQNMQTCPATFVWSKGWFILKRRGIKDKSKMLNAVWQMHTWLHQVKLYKAIRSEAIFEHSLPVGYYLQAVSQHSYPWDIVSSRCSAAGISQFRIYRILSYVTLA